jgi:glycosyltransferase involved in cell wall biosynthesis
MCGTGWSCSAHAKDIWTSPEWELREKLANMRWAVTCTAHGHDYLAGLSPDPSKVTLLYHGIDLGRFPEPVNPGSKRDGSNPAEPVRILTVGRAVEKKGLDTLIDALAALPAELYWTWTHIGGGMLKESLAAQVERNGLSDRVEMLGARPQEFVLRTYKDSDLFVLPSRIADDGDRDGLPNVLLEAQSQGLACISTPVSGIVELLEDGKNGRLVPPDDVAALSAAIGSFIRSPEIRNAFGAAGMKKVRTLFDHRATISRLLDRFEESGFRPVSVALTSHAAQ